MSQQEHARRHRERRTARILAVLTVIASLALLTVAPTPSAEAAEEVPGNPALDIGNVWGRIGEGVANDSTTNTRTGVFDSIYYGIVHDKDTTPDSSSDTTAPWLSAADGRDRGLWSYISRGRDNEWVMPTSINVSNRSALGYKPNDPGRVTANTPFLVGTIRHNNYPIYTEAKYLHASIDVSINGVSESFPFYQDETTNDVETTVVPRQGGAWAYWGPNLEGCAPGSTYNGYRYGWAVTTGDTTNTYYCYYHVGAGRGNYDMYTNDPANYPDAVDTPNHTPLSDDVLTMTKTTATKLVVSKDGIPYRLVLWGFVPSSDGACPQTVPAGAEHIDKFITKEATDSFGCLYGSFDQERYVTIVKRADTDDAFTGTAIPQARFTTTAGPEASRVSGGAPRTTVVPNVGGFVANGSFSSRPLAPTGWGEAGAAAYPDYMAFLVGRGDFAITETVPAAAGDGRWDLDDIRCLNGIGQEVGTRRDGDSVRFDNVGVAPSAAAVPITCTFVNTYKAGRVSIAKTLDDADNGGLTGAPTFTATYAVTVTNTGNLEKWTGAITDTPGFAPGLTIDSAVVADSREGLDTAPEAVPVGGAYTLTTGESLAAKASKTYYIRFTVTHDKTAEGYDPAALACGATPRTGLRNTAATTGEDWDGPDDNTACGPFTPREITIHKAGTQPNGTPYPDGTYPLAGAAFALYDTDPSGAPTAPLQVLDNASGSLTSFQTRSLETGRTYWLVETKAPAGHVLLPRPVAFRIGVGPGADKPTTIEVLDDPASLGGIGITATDASGGAGASLKVTDMQAGTLPLTGGPGIYPNIAAGALLVAGAMVISMVTTRRRGTSAQQRRNDW